MFVVLLKFSENREKASDFMAGHKKWIKRGFDDGVFILVGSIKPKGGGAILAHSVSVSELEARVKMDPFVIERVVEAEIIEIEPARVADDFGALLN